ncbi:MAG: carbon-nitrogen hydrolase family protein [Pseudomonadota bacterium]
MTESLLRIAAAQSIAVPGDIAANVALHCRLIVAAAAAGVELLVFPELSLSGYELPLLQACVVTPQDPALAPLRALVAAHGITVVVGAPLPADGQRPFIGAITFFPDGRTGLYRKHHLHSGEERFVVAGQADSCTHLLGQERYALAICADIAQDCHPQAASAAGATLYLAGVLISESGYAADAARLKQHAEHFGMAVLMANHGGPSGGYRCAGRSAFWSSQGCQMIAAPGLGNGLVIASRAEETWSGEWLALEG